MLKHAIHVAEVLALALATLTFARVFFLFKRDSKKRASDTPLSILDDEVITVDDSVRHDFDKQFDAFKEAQVFAGIQMVPIKQEFKQLTSPDMAWLRKAIGFYLLGAADYFALKSGCNTKTRDKLGQLILTANLKLDHMELMDVLALAKVRPSGSDEEQMILAGAEAAKQWKDERCIDEAFQLRPQLNAWGVFT